MIFLDETHPSISWKLSNINSMINKETHEFKFNGFTWKLRAKVESNDANSLKIYLKNISANSERKDLLNTENDENVIELELENAPKETNLTNYEASLSKMSKKDIITIYYKMEYGQKAPYKELNLKNINLNTNEEILISKLSYEEWSAYKSKELGFTIYLNTEHIHSTILLQLADNLKDYLSYNDVSVLKKEDLISIVKYSPLRNEEQDTLLFFIIKWGKIYNYLYIFSI